MNKTVDLNKTSVETQVEAPEYSDELIECVEKHLGAATIFSPYRFASLLSQMKGSPIKPQMIYNYVKKGFIESGVNELGKKTIDRTEARRFALKYLSNNVK